ncbi:MAG: ribonuclease HII [Alphaproteobacteria bacterium]|nr:ribonuclease HII [Alphaproteobacteria bacterium]
MVADQPDYSFETQLMSVGTAPVAGIDEAGRGPLAGPVVVAACILDANHIPLGLNDSKKLAAAKREALYEQILATSHASIVSVSAQTIDSINIRAATLQGMAQAVRGLAVQPAYALIDGRDVPPGLPCPGDALIKGDARSVSIAAASILAKVTRDRLMVRAAEFWPGYGFERHMGYGTEAHLDAIKRLGPCPIHRLSFAPLKG